MRKIKKIQMELGEIPISEITFDLRSRDEIPKLLMGLQYIYCTPEIREEVFSILETIIPENVDSTDGRPGMELWKILVLGTLRLSCNWNYDKLQEMANNHITLRQMLGHGAFYDKHTYALQTLKDNISLLTPEVLDQINQVVVKAGHKLVKKKENEEIKGRCDSFVVKTNVHYPTDINLLFDAICKVITLISQACLKVGISKWRQKQHNIKKIKKLFRKVQKLKHSNSKDAKKKVLRERLIIDAHQAYIKLVQSFYIKIKATIKTLQELKIIKDKNLSEIKRYMGHVIKQIDLIQRRVINGEVIPHNEKVFSIFEEHTEWICKGKAGISQELGLRVCIFEDQYGFILHHQVMQKLTDDKIALLMVEEAKRRFPELSSCSFDKGFYTPKNKIDLNDKLDKVVLPKKGKLSSKDKEEEYSEEFIKIRSQHSAVESAINALENHGLDRCPDHGIIGFERYVATSILARNIQVLGSIIQRKKIKSQKRREKLKQSKKRFYSAA